MVLLFIRTVYQKVSRIVLHCQSVACMPKFSPMHVHPTQALGIASASLDCAVKYSMERNSFGEPISSLYAIQVRCVNMQSLLHASVGHMTKHAFCLLSAKIRCCTRELAFWGCFWQDGVC